MRLLVLFAFSFALILLPGCASEEKRTGSFKSCMNQCRSYPKAGNQRAYCHQTCRQEFRR